MKTSTIKVRDMLSVLSVLGVEKRIGEVPGVESVTVNYAAGSATVRYDETRLNIADIKSHVRQSGYESTAPTATSASDGQQCKAALIAQPSTPAAAEAKAPAAAPAAMPAPATPAAEGKEGADAEAHQADRHPSSGRESVSRPGAHPGGGDIVTGRAVAPGVPPSPMAVLMLSVVTVSIGYGLALPLLPYLIERLLGTMRGKFPAQLAC